MQTFALKSHAARPFNRPNTPAQALRQTPAVRSILHSPRIQPKLKIGAVDDPAEREADQVAGQVMRMPDKDIGAAGAASIAPRHDGAPASSLVQRKDNVAAASGGEPAAPAVQTTLGALGGGAPLPASERAFFEPRFGRSFEDVRIHTGRDADAATSAVHARAFTLGRDIAFAGSEYRPGTEDGRKLIAHELTHAVQQNGNPDVVQRLIRTPYPWNGVVTPGIGARIRSTPDASDLANVLDVIPQGQLVRVVSASGKWLKVESRYRGFLIAGYMHESLVDDAAAASMEASVGTLMVWNKSRPGSGTNFEVWASAAAEVPFPAVTAATVMNCWEAVLLAAYKSGVLKWKWIHDLYTSVPLVDWVDKMSKGARKNYAVPGPNPDMPQRGDLVFFNGLAHVALATGNGSDVYTFWPPPNVPVTPGGTPDRVKVYTIEVLVDWWTRNIPPAPKVEFGPPTW